MARHERENPNSRNFGLGTRCLERVGLQALREGMQSFASISTMHDRWRLFAVFAKDELRLHSLNKIEKCHVEAYANKLLSRLDKKEISAATAQNYLSTVNRVMEIARGDRTVRLDPVKEGGIPERKRACEQSKATTPEAHQRATEAVSGRVAAMTGLQREFGLRFAESAKIDASRAFSQALKNHSITVKDGTKGGRSRDVPITRPEQIIALQAASVIQGNHRSMIPAEQTYVQFRAEAYKQIENTQFNFHGQRHHYAQQRYQAIVGAPCPIVGGVARREQHPHISRELGISISTARELDYAARLQVSNELGHGRIDVTNAYLG